MAEIDNYNIAKITEIYLTENLKEAVLKNIVENLVENFRKEATDIVKKEVEKVSIDGVGHIRDLSKIRDEIKVYCEWNDNVK